MKAASVSQLTAEDIERSSTLTKADIGKWAVIHNGCITPQSSEQQARQLARFLNNDSLINR